MIKCCALCGEEKLATQEFFYKQKRTKDKLCPWCIKCHNKRRKEYYQKNPELFKAKSKKEYEDRKMNFPEKIKYKAYIHESKKKNREFYLIFEDFCYLINLPCYYCQRKDGLNGLDRLNSNEGYYLANVVTCCRQCNIAKNNHSMNDFVTMCKLVACNF